MHELAPCSVMLHQVVFMAGCYRHAQVFVGVQLVRPIARMSYMRACSCGLLCWAECECCYFQRQQIARPIVEQVQSCIKTGGALEISGWMFKMHMHMHKDVLVIGFDFQDLDLGFISFKQRSSDMTAAK